MSDVLTSTSPWDVNPILRGLKLVLTGQNAPAPVAPAPAPAALAAPLFDFSNVTQAAKPGFVRGPAGNLIPTDELIRAVGGAESNNGQNTVNKKHPEITGTFQMSPAAKMDVANHLGITPDQVNSSDPHHAGTYLGMLAGMPGIDGDLSKTLAAYNWGIGNVTKQGMGHLPAETQNYIQKVEDQLGLTQTVNGAQLNSQIFPDQVYANLQPAIARAAPVAYNPTQVTAPSVPFNAPPPRGANVPIDLTALDQLFQSHMPAAVDQKDLDVRTAEGARKDVQIAHAIARSAFGGGLLGILANIYSAPSDARVAAATRQYAAVSGRDAKADALNATAATALANAFGANNTIENKNINDIYEDALKEASLTTGAKQADRTARIQAADANNNNAYRKAALAQDATSRQATLMAQEATGAASATNATTQGQNDNNIKLTALGYGSLAEGGNNPRQIVQRQQALGDSEGIPMTSTPGEKSDLVGARDVVRGFASAKPDPNVILNGIATEATLGGYLNDPNILSPQDPQYNAIMNAGRRVQSRGKNGVVTYDPKSKPDPGAMRAALMNVLSSQPAAARVFIQRLAAAGARGATFAARRMDGAQGQ